MNDEQKTKMIQELVDAQWLADILTAAWEKSECLECRDIPCPRCSVIARTTGKNKRFQ